MQEISLVLIRVSLVFYLKNKKKSQICNKTFVPTFDRSSIESDLKIALKF